MAFLIDCKMEGYRVLGVRSGKSQKGTEWRSIDVYKDGRTAEVSCTNGSLFPAVDALSEMDTVDLYVRAVAGRERSYLTMLDAPRLTESEVS